ncbi:MAG: hypothetical protein WD851_09545 [Pirellulales bacterium]
MPAVTNQEAPSTPTGIARKILNGQHVPEEERQRLPPHLLAFLALRGHFELSMRDRFRLPKSTLVQLAISRTITLTRRERDRLSPIILAQLAVGGHVHLDSDEYQRIPRSIRALLEEKVRPRGRGTSGRDQPTRAIKASNHRN